MTSWTIMLYLAGADDLEPYMARTLQALEEAGPPTGGEVIVQLARAPLSLLEPVLPGRQPTGLDGDWHGVRRYRLRRRPEGADPTRFHSELLADLGQVNTADPATLADFVHDARSQFPAERTLLVLSGHGMGFVGLALDLTAGPKPCLMSLRGMVMHLRALREPLDMLLLDACQMNCLEIACQLALPRPVAHWLITPASQAPRAGLNYVAMLQAVAAGGADPTGEVAARVAATLEPLAGLQVLALNLDPARWQAAALAARDATGAMHMPMFLEAAKACAYPPRGKSMRFLVHWPDSPTFPDRYHYLYRRLRFARLSRWNRLIPPAAPDERGEPAAGPQLAPGPLLFAWLKTIRKDLSPEEVTALQHGLGWADQ